MARTQKTPDRNPVEVAVDLVGGPTWAASICVVSQPTLMSWRKAGKISLAAPAVRLWRALRERGSDISLDELVGLETLMGAPGGGHRAARAVREVGGSRRRTDESVSDHVSEVATLTPYEQAA